MSLRKVLFVGIPGAGKGTQAKLLIPYGFRHISTGQIIRKAWMREDTIVMPYKEDIEAGSLLPDKEIFELIDGEINLLTNEIGYVFDGAIRNIAQAEISLKRNLVEETLYFHLDEKEAITRLNKRREIEGRKDDSLEAIARRIEIYKRETFPMINYMAKKFIPTIVIDASKNILEVNQEILRVLSLK